MTEQKTRTLEELTIRNGEFYDEDGKRVNVQHVKRIEIEGFVRYEDDQNPFWRGGKVVYYLIAEEITRNWIEKHTPEKPNAYFVFRKYRDSRKAPGRVFVGRKEIFEGKLVDILVADIDYYKILGPANSWDDR